MSFEEPPMKKHKQNENSSHDDVIAQYIKNILNNQRNLKVILADEYTKPVPLTKAYVGSIKDVKNISTTMKTLNENLPLKELSHLKRARGRSILICHVNDASSSASINEFMDKHVPGLSEVFEFFREVDVPAVMPKMKWQNTQISKTWGCNFHPDNYLENLVSKTQDLQLHRTYMALTLEAVRWYCKKSNIDVTEDVLNSVNAAVVVNPLTNSVVAVSFDESIEHPVKHAAMVVIDNVAKTQGGGSWPTEDIKNKNTGLSGIDSELLQHLKEVYPDIRIGAQEIYSQCNIESGGEKDYNAPYLCTNHNIYMLREPCVMCSMGLTHARVKRMFFCKENEKLGGLVSRAKLHTVPFLNHHFEVFTGFLTEPLQETSSSPSVDSNS